MQENVAKIARNLKIVNLQKIARRIMVFLNVASGDFRNGKKTFPPSSILICIHDFVQMFLFSDAIKNSAMNADFAALRQSAQPEMEPTSGIQTASMKMTRQTRKKSPQKLDITLI